MSIISDKICTIKTHCMRSETFTESRVVYEVMWKCGTSRKATDNNIKRRMRFAWWITKTTGTHSEYVIFSAFSTTTMVCKGFSFYILHFPQSTFYGKRCLY